MIRLRPILRPIARTCGWLFGHWLRTLHVRILSADDTLIASRNFVAGDALYAVRERDLFALASLAEGRGFHALVADGNDGDWATAFVSPLGCRITRGSTLHHGLYALRALVHVLQAGDGPAAIVIDGPLGPAGEAKEGIAAVAAFTGRLIVPAAAAATRKLVFTKSWAEHILPLPFARVVIARGEPIAVRRGASRAEMTVVAQSVTRELRRLEARAEEMLAA
jgi:lysophospholipid acyltransferase (LPLAT)-like uncharacterized protein